MGGIVGLLYILIEVSLLYTYLYSPLEGHLGQVIHIMLYLKSYSKRKIDYDLIILC